MRIAVGSARNLHWVENSHTFSMFDWPLYLFECARGLLPKDIDELNGVA